MSKENSSKELKETIRCWQFFNCNKVKCPAYGSEDTHCWLISGTYCRDEIQGKFNDKLEECVKCRFFLSHMDGEQRYQTMENIIDNLHSIVVQLKEKEKHLELENIYLKEKLAKEYAPDLIIGPNKLMKQIYGLINKVATTDSTVLLTGETGTGKGLFAKAIHYHSKRAKYPFVPVNCSTLSESLLESELFGHVKGAFTGAASDKPGMFEIANKGTFFFDEIGDISPTIQGKLLEVLQDKSIKRVGGTKTIKVDVRIIAATNKDIKNLTKEKIFREDLFYRLSTFPIHLPPLRERKEDISILAEHFLEKFSREREKDIRGIHKEVLKKLIEYDWPGNIRELENVMERAVILEEGRFIYGKSLPEGFQEQKRKLAAKLKTLSEIEIEHILMALEKNNDNKTKAALSLGIPRRTLYEKMKRYDL